MRLIKWALGLVVFVLVLVSIAPIGLKYYSLHWLEKEGYDAKIGSLGVNVFTGKLTIGGLQIRQANASGIRIDLLEAHLKPSKLSDKELSIRKLKVQGLRVDFAELKPRVESLTAPVKSFINRHAPEWRFEVSNGLAEQVELCRKGATNEGRALAQCFSLGSATMNDVSLENTSRGWQFASRSTFDFQRMYFKDDTDGASLVYLGEAQVRDVVADKTELRIGQIGLAKLHLVERGSAETERLSAPYQTQIDQLLINDIVEIRSPTQTRLHLGLVDFTSLRQTLHKDNSAGFVILSRLREIFPIVDEGLKKRQQDEQSQVIVEVMKTRVVDGGVAWLDDSVVPPAQESLTGLSFELGPINTSQPNKRTPINIVARLGDSGKVNIQGHAAPLAEQPNFAVEGQINGLDLARLSAYTETAFAEKVTQGVLHARFRTDAQAGVMQGDATAELINLKSSGGSNRNGVLSLRNSFERLKNKNNSVQFDLFYNLDLLAMGNLSEALGRNAKRTLSDLANGRAPARPAVATKKVVLTFEPLKYNPEATSLTGAQELRLKDIVSIAKEQPSKTLVICPVSTGGEWAALYRQGRALKSGEKVPSVERDHLLSMARARAKVLSQDLSALELSSRRYKICDVRLDLADQGPSYLDAELR